MGKKPPVTVSGEELRRAYEAGETIDAIAARISRSYSSTHARLLRAGTKFRGRGPAPRNRTTE